MKKITIYLEREDGKGWSGVMFYGEYSEWPIQLSDSIVKGLIDLVSLGSPREDLKKEIAVTVTVG